MSRRKKIITGIGLWGAFIVTAVAVPMTTTTMLTATLVASSCVGEVVTVGAEGRSAGTAGTVDFGVINPKVRSAPVRTFALRLSETVGGETGCSAFEAYGRQYPVATLSFGDLGGTQLDEDGVILRWDDGRDAGLRVRVTPLDIEGVFPKSGAPGYVTATHSAIDYPITFAAKGLFAFQATLSQWKGKKSGAFSGALTVTVAYR